MKILAIRKIFYCTICKKYVNVFTQPDETQLRCDICWSTSLVHKDTWESNFTKK